ncbi:MAG: hypothetical protein U5K69_06615 [Balneolaceae bacterium]|nr:hypothetical protein [Balneolaceae bacterium]
MGLITPDGGTIMVRGEQVDIDDPRQAMDQGISFVTEDRKESGIVPI